MNKKPTFHSFLLTLAVAGVQCAGAASGHAQGAVATISDVAASGGYDYTIILQNTGTTDLNGFWYGWTDSGNNLLSTPSSLGNNLNWGQTLFNNTSIQWQNSTGTALAPGDFGTFTFFSSSTPAAMTTPPVGESVAYVNTIGFNEGIAGGSTPVFSPALVATPEPSSVALLAFGVVGLVALRYRRFC
jgi:hypothetical protein